MAQTEVVPAKPRVGRTADPCVMVIFGFTGDLTRRKLDSRSLQSRQPAIAVARVCRHRRGPQRR